MKAVAVFFAVLLAVVYVAEASVNATVNATVNASATAAPEGNYTSTAKPDSTATPTPTSGAFEMFPTFLLLATGFLFVKLF